MSLTNYNDLLAGIHNWLQRTDIIAQFPDFITLFEAEANRRLRVRQQENLKILVPTSVANILGSSGSSVGDQNFILLTVDNAAGFTGGDTISVANVVGTTEANGTWKLDANLVTSNILILIGATFVNPWISGGTVTVTGSASLPADFLTWRRVNSLGAPQRELSYVEPSYMGYEYPDQQGRADFSSIFTIEGSVLRIMPPNSTPILLNYWQKIPALTATNTTNWLMTAHPDLYLFGSLVEASAYAVNQDVIPMWKARRDELFDGIDKLDKKARGPSRVRVFSPTP